MKKAAFLIYLILVLTSCTMNGISVHTSYLSRQNLASYYVHTPDPRLNDPPVGQRLIVSWSFPKQYLNYRDLHLELSVRFRIKEQFIEKIPLCTAKGTFVYSLLNEDYFNKQGILTYKVELFGDGELLDQWKHQMWSELITFDDELVHTCSPQIDQLLSPELEEEEKEQESDPNYEFEETTLPEEFRLQGLST